MPKRNAIIYAGILLLVAGGAGTLLLARRTPGPAATLQELPEERRQEYELSLARARSSIREQAWTEAVAALRRCLEIHDGDPEAHTLLGKASIGQLLDPDAPFTDEQKDALVAEGVRSIDRALEIDPDHVPALLERFHVRHIPMFRAYDPDGAFEDGARVIQLDENNTGFYQLYVAWLLGGVRFTRERGEHVAFDSSIGLEAAEGYAGRLLDRVPPGSDLYAQAVRGLGVVYLYLGDFDRASERLAELDRYRLSPEIRAANLLDLGYSHYRAGRHREAAGAFIHSLEVEESLQARWLLHLAYQALGRDASHLPESHRFPLPDPGTEELEGIHLRFREMAAELGVAKVDGAGPSAFADYDGDGDDDILATGCDTYTALYRNDGDRFVDVTIEAGLESLDSGFSLNLVDYDDDGDLDIYIARNGWSGPAPNILLRNDGSGAFEDVSEASGLADPGSGFVSLWSDVDRDGLLDVFVCNGVLRDGSTNRLYHNEGDGSFVDVTERAGLGSPRRWGTIGAAIGDYDRDGDPDIFVNGRHEAPNRLYRNRGDGVFDEVAREAGLEAPPHDGYVALFLDHDNDARPDIFSTNVANWDLVLRGMAGQATPASARDVMANAPHLYRNLGDGTFADVTFASGLHRPLGVMAANAGDLDNDGFLDLYLGTGDPDLKRLEPSVLYHNRGDGTFVDRARALGLDHLGKGHGFTFADFDRDGDLDIYAPQGGFYHGDLWANPFYRNEAGSENHWLHLRLVGVTSNRFAVGAQVTLHAGETMQYREVTGGVGYGSTNSYAVAFGLGERTEVERVEILWPSGERQTLAAPPIDALLVVTEGEEGWRVETGGEGGG